MAQKRTYETCGKSFTTRKAADRYARNIANASGIRVPVYETTGAKSHPPSSSPAPATEQPRFLVVSYDEDQQQWFYDIVIAPSAEAAKELICEIRPYVIDADASTVAQMKQIAQQITAQTPAEIAAHIAAIREESGVEDDEYIPTNYFDSKTGKVIERL